MRNPKKTDAVNLVIHKFLDIGMNLIHKRY